MEKRLFLIVILLFLFRINSIAQTVFTSKAFIENNPEDTYFFHLKIDEKILRSDWQEYLKKLGRTKETSKDHYFSSGVDLKNISYDLDGILSRISDDKDYTSIYVVFVDKKGKILSDSTVNEKQAKLFLEDFISQAYKKEELRMANDQLKNLKSDRDEAEKKVKRIESKIESNLKSQGKISSQIAETMDLINKNSDQKAALESELELESITEERRAEIKTQLENLKNGEAKTKTSSKSEKKMEKKVSALEELKQELDDTKLDLSEKTMVYETRKAMVEKIK